MHRERLSSKKWLALFAFTVILLAAVYAGFNFVTDPFGAFGDRFLHWWSYDMTQNPRVSKISYLEQHKDEYDSYIIGSSASSSFPIDELNEYADARFFNMIMYGSDMLDVEQTARWLMENCEVKNLILCVQTHDAMQYDVNSGKLTDIMHCKADGSDPLKFYARYLFCDWRYGWAKLKDLRLDKESGYLQAAYDCFDPATGAYDKSKRDVEGISDLAEYVTRDDYKIFAAYPHYNYNISCIDRCMESLRNIKALCDDNGVKMTVICPPMYSEYLKYYRHEDLIRFGVELSKITDFWDFTMSSASYEPRYFYDETHFRNCLGSMALARIYGGDSYIADDFGYYIRQETAQAALEAEFAAAPLPEEEYTAKVPIITYHETYEHQAEYGITTALFEEHMKALHEAGCTAIDLDDLRDYVLHGKELPERPVLITFDDGYKCNFDQAGPVLEKYGFKATVFAIGVSVGKDSYKDTGRKMNPHFSADEAMEMISRGLFRVQSHGYDVHEVEGLDPDPIRIGVLPREGETETEYVDFLKEDARTMKRILLSMGEQQGVFAYPHGKYTELSEVVLAGEGIWSTVTTQEKIETVVKGLPQSLMAMGRFSMEKWVTADQLLEKIGYDRLTEQPDP
ncbi:MAG: polysaccharide deacetylase family protein [Firmicutes bacterium]|nr:polysaccharide deacetylase family protein [Bacillota bacterium]